MFEEWVKTLFKSWFKSANFTAKVLEVNKENDTCTVQEEDRPKKFKVRLTSVIDSYTNRFVIYPKEGSYVTCSVRNNNAKEVYVSQYGEVDEVVINGGELGGLTITPKLVEELNKTNELVSAIKESLDGWVTSPSDGGAALKTLWTSKGTGKDIGDFSEIEDTKVKH